MAHLGDAQPDVRVPLRVGEAKLDVLGLVGVEVKALVSQRRAAGRDCAVLVTVVEHVQRPGVLIPFVEGDAHPDNVLGFLEVVRDAAPIVLGIAVEDVSLARPARVRRTIIVPGVGWYAALWDASAARSPRVVSIGVYVDPGPVAGVDESCDEGGLRGVVFSGCVNELDSSYSVHYAILVRTTLTLCLFWDKQC